MPRSKAMHRVVRPLMMTCTLLCAVGIAAGWAEAQDRASTQEVSLDQRPPLRPLPWMVLSVGKDEQSLLVGYSAGGCAVRRGSPGTETQESNASIRIVVGYHRRVRRHHHRRLCPAVGETGALTVTLRDVIAGRNIIGPRRVGTTGKPNGAVYRQVSRNGVFYSVLPRVLGLSPDDARWVLVSQGFRPRTIGHGREVVREQPAPNSVPPGQHGAFHGNVSLTVGY